MEYKILTSSFPAGLTQKVEQSIIEGWTPISGHQVVEIHRQNRYSGAQLMSTQIQLEYTQTITKT